MSEKKAKQTRKSRTNEPQKLLNALAARTIYLAKHRPAHGWHDLVPPKTSLWDCYVTQVRCAMGPFLTLFDEDLQMLAAEEITNMFNFDGRVLLWTHTGLCCETDPFMPERKKNDHAARFLLEQIIKPAILREKEEQLLENGFRQLIEQRLAQKQSVRQPEKSEASETESQTSATEEEQNPAQAQSKQECLELWSGMARDLQVEGYTLPPFLEQALQRACRQEQRDQVRVFLEALMVRCKGGSRSNSKLPTVGGILQRIDPGLFFSFARKSLFQDKEQVKGFLLQVTRRLQALCPNRNAQIEELVLAVARRVMGDEDALYPLFYGPAGTAKTFLVELLAEVLSEAGLATRAIMQPMTQMGGYNPANNEIAMALQGTSAQWSDARYGMLLTQTMTAETRLCLTVLDEVDKCNLHDYLVTLLDPRQALQDSFLREFTPQIDMRHKCFFVLTANDISRLSSSANAALWSRLVPIEMPAYGREEALELVARLVGLRLDPEEADESLVRELTAETFRNFPGQLPSVRTLIDDVKKRLFKRQFPFLKGVQTKAVKSSSQTIGFKVEIERHGKVITC